MSSSVASDTLSRKHGAFIQKNGKTRFNLWAPDARNVTLKLKDNQLNLLLQADSEGWYSIEVKCPPGSAYSYLINDSLEVPDPASRAQLQGVHGPSLVVDPGRYEWRCRNWQGRPWHETVIYELHVGAYGGYEQICERLPELAKLGITAIELMPLGEFPGSRNWGYDGVLPYAPDSSYGPPQALQHLIDTAHAHGIMVFIDVVYNHFGPDGNYLGQYAKSFFRHDLQTPWGDAINFRRPEVCNFFIDNALMWLEEYRCDGLRFDAVHAIPDPDFLTKMLERIRNRIPAGRHIHLMLENEHNQARLIDAGYTAQWNDDGHNVLHVMLTGESQGYYSDFQLNPAGKLARLLGEGFIYQGEHDRRQRARGEPSGHLPPTAFILFLQNHDQTGNRAFGERLISLADPEALRAATALLLLGPMIPMLFMGEEWGSRNPFLYFTDHHGQLAQAVREGRRSEFSEFAEFRDEASRTRIPDPNALTTFTASAADYCSRHEPEHQRWLDEYTYLLKLRQTRITPYLKAPRFIEARPIGQHAVEACWQLDAGATLRMQINLGTSACQAQPATEPLLFSTETGSPSRPDQLPPHTTRVYLEI